MDVQEYFEVHSTMGHVLHAEMKGFWSDRNIDEIGGEFLAQFKAAVDDVSSHGPFVVLADLAELAVLTKRGRAFLTQAMAYASDHGLHKAIEVIPNAITTLSANEAAQHSDKGNFRVVVKSFEEAERLVEQFKEEL